MFALELVALDSQRHLAGFGSGSEDDKGGTLVEAAGVGGMEFVGCDVSIVNADNGSVSIDREAKLVSCTQHTTAFLVHGMDAHMNQILAIGMPCFLVWHDLEGNGVTCGLDLVAGKDFSVLVGHCLDIACRIVHIVPFDAVAFLRIVAVRLFAEALAVDKQFHLVTIGVGIERYFAAGLPVPAFGL